MRFDITVGVKTADESTQAGADVSSGPLVSSDGPYTVTLDASQLRANMESAVSLLVENDGSRATDLAPYLGVSAHAVFIRVEEIEVEVRVSDFELSKIHGMLEIVP